MRAVPTLPQDDFAERSCVGALISDSEAFNEILQEGLTEKDFYNPKLALIFKSMEYLNLENRAIDLVSVSHKLQELGLFEKSGGKQYLGELVQDFYTSANIQLYAKIVKEKSLLRMVIKKAKEVIQKGSFFEEGSVQDFLQEVESSFFTLATFHKKQGILHLKDALKQNLIDLEKSQDGDEAFGGLATGFKRVDEKLLGLRPGQLVIIAARPGIGKTSFALNIMNHVAKTYQKPVMIFSYEMLATELSMRLLSSEAEIDSVKIRKKNYQKQDLVRLKKAVTTLSQVPIYINDGSHLTLIDIKAQSRKIKADQGLSLLVIDYLQLMQSHVKKQSREQEIAEISRGLKELAKELGCPVIALSQLNRSATARTDKRPALQDLRESGAIEQDADIVCLLHREDAYQFDSPLKGIAEVIIAKNRSGEPGTVKIKWVGSQTSFKNLSEQEENPLNNLQDQMEFEF
jgi:replicative DNA helicase